MLSTKGKQSSAVNNVICVLALWEKSIFNYRPIQRLYIFIFFLKWKIPYSIVFAVELSLYVDGENINILANKPLHAAGIAEDNALGWKIVWKMERYFSDGLVLVCLFVSQFWNFVFLPNFHSLFACSKFNPQRCSINTQILLTTLLIFLMAQVGRSCLRIKAFHICDHFLYCRNLYVWPSSGIVRRS